jgi:hypothetical protein
MSFKHYDVLRELLHKNGNCYGGDKPHKRLIDLLVINRVPLLGVSSGVSSFEHSRAVALSDNGKRGLEDGCVDLVFYSPNELVVVEGKVFRKEGSGKYSRKKANSQLRSAYDFFQERFDISPRMIGVYVPFGERRIHAYDLRHGKGGSSVVSGERAIDISEHVFTGGILPRRLRKPEFSLE